MTPTMAAPSPAGCRGVLLALALLAACGPEPGPDSRAVIHDLVVEHSLGEVRAEPGTVDLGTPAARPYLVSGWSWDETAGETAGDGTSFVWSEGEASVVDFFLARPGELALTFRAFPFTYDGAPEQGVEVTVNGHRVAEVALAPGPGEHSVALPATALAAGPNRLLLRYRWSRSPSETGASGDRRRLAVGWDWLRFGDGEGAAAPRADPGAGRLLLPYGSQVDHYLDLPAGSALALAGVSAQGGEPGRLEVLLAREGAAEVAVRRLDPGSGRRTLELSAAGAPAAGRGLARLSLRAVGKAGAGGLVLTRPVILAPAAAAAPEASPAPAAESTAPARRSPILLYLVDTLRVDRLGCYGYGRPTSPRLDAFARRATRFENALAQTSWTKPAVASLLTGLPPRRHGVNHPEDGLPEGITLLAQRLAAEGYATAGFTANAHVSPASGFARGFDHFEYLIQEPNDAAAVNRRVFAWLEAADLSRPIFLFVHAIDPHAPYQPPEPFRRRLAAQVADPAVGSVESIRAIARGEVPVTERLTADLLALYDAEVAANDAAFGELLDELERRGLADEALVAFLSDHGEEFHEHGVFGHGWDLYGEVLRVPLLLRLPGQRQGRRVARPVQQIDLLPTLLTYLGLPVPGDLPGTDLLRLADEEPPPEALPDQRPLHAYMDYEGREGASVWLGDWHLIEPLTGRFAPAPELYHHRQDPGERRDLAADRPVLAGYLRRLLRAHLQATAGTATPTAVDLDPATRRQLEALGYL